MAAGLSAVGRATIGGARARTERASVLVACETPPVSRRLQPKIEALILRRASAACSRPEHHDRQDDDENDRHTHTLHQRDDTPAARTES